MQVIDCTGRNKLVLNYLVKREKEKVASHKMRVKIIEDRIQESGVRIQNKEKNEEWESGSY